MIIGITGTRHKPTKKQLESFFKVFTDMRPTEFHHGCCTGVDSITSRIVNKYDEGIVVVGHPPIDTKCIGNYFSSYDVEAKRYLERNKDIVKACDYLIALPKTELEQKRSGTWATIRYAQRNHRRTIAIVAPCGRIEISEIW
jgi:hypothetical protein